MCCGIKLAPQKKLPDRAEILARLQELGDRQHAGVGCNPR